ncbi:hypothetical protein PENNAL_c0029G08445 [Penicillium nalgiovense]|uniref:FAD linked oxidase N-terminal domain-containing protein n=1 Tax=Penicillium nalgiovense TaxID=60175 RepID=A0A1V6Y9M6_PENNA|nr:hypothetical protein PENNAL_c0029G08445 [Penicillium nalgiovense]
MAKMTSIIGILMGVLTTATAASIPTGSAAAAAAAPSSLGVSPPSGNVLTGNAGYICSLLNRVFSENELLKVMSPYYDILIDEAWSDNCRLNASCIVTPESAQEVSRLLQILSILETKFAIALVDITTTRDSVQSPYNLTALGGREVVVGVGGYIIESGGPSTFYNAHGLAIDSVTRFQVVLPNGTIVDATPTEHTDLYKGLKGGLNNFGETAIVYQITFHSPNRSRYRN